MNHKLVRRAAAAIFTGALAFGAFPAAAQQGGYVGASVGQYKENDYSDGETAVGFRFFGGYQFNKFVAAEAGYLTASFDVGPTTVTASGLTLGALVFAPISDQFSIFGTVGLFNWNLSNVDISGTDPYFGLGALFYVNKNIGLRLEYDSYKLSSDSAGASTTASAITLGAQFRF